MDKKKKWLYRAYITLYVGINPALLRMDDFLPSAAIIRDAWIVNSPFSVFTLTPVILLSFSTLTTQ